jgi:hypothetical protein
MVKAQKTVASQQVSPDAVRPTIVTTVPPARQAENK